MSETAENMDFEAEQNDSATVETPKNVISDEIRKAFNDAIAAEKQEDMIKIDLIAAGAKFKQATKIYNDLMVEAGLAVSKEDKDKAVEAACKDVDLSTEDGFDAAVKAVDTAIESTNAKGAAVMVRAYARKNKIECFKKPKSAGGTRNTAISDFYEALYENPQMTKEEAHKFIVEHGSKNTLRWESAHQRVRELINRVAAKTA